MYIVALHGWQMLLSFEMRMNVCIVGKLLLLFGMGLNVFIYMATLHGWQIYALLKLVSLSSGHVTRLHCVHYCALA